MVYLFFYRSLWMLVFPLLPIASLFSKKIRQGLKLRMQPRYKSLNLGEASTPVIWVHCASGEFEYAKPLLRQFKDQELTGKPVKTLVTFFSPSYAQNILASPDVDLAEPLPLDTPGGISSFLKRHRPICLLIARTDLWPELLHQCERQSIPRILFSATRSHKSKLVDLLFCWFQVPLYNKLSNIFVVGEVDKKYLQNLGVKTTIEVIGDTRYDQVFYRLAQPPKREQPLLWPTNNRTRLVFGSTWAEDDKALLAAIKNLQTSQRLIDFSTDFSIAWVPHEPTRATLKRLEWHLRQLGLHSIRYSDLKNFESWPDNHILLMDQVGLLAELYSEAHGAFVGGSFKRKVHSVMEPLACGCWCVVGPYFRNNAEALKFKEKKLKGWEIPMVSVVHSAEELSTQLNKIREIHLADFHEPSLQTSMHQPLTSQKAKLEIQKEIQGLQGATFKLHQALMAQLLLPRNH